MKFSGRKDGQFRSGGLLVGDRPFFYGTPHHQFPPAICAGETPESSHGKYFDRWIVEPTFHHGPTPFVQPDLSFTDIETGVLIGRWNPYYPLFLPQEHPQWQSRVWCWGS